MLFRSPARLEMGGCNVPGQETGAPLEVGALLNGRGFFCRAGVSASDAVDLLRRCENVSGSVGAVAAGGGKMSPRTGFIYFGFGWLQRGHADGTGDGARGMAGFYRRYSCYRKRCCLFPLPGGEG